MEDDRHRGSNTEQSVSGHEYGAKGQSSVILDDDNNN